MTANHVESDDLGTEPEWKSYEITKPVKCSGCGERFKVGSFDDLGDFARVFRVNGDGPYQRYHEECWPWS